MRLPQPVQYVTGGTAVLPVVPLLAQEQRLGAVRASLEHFVLEQLQPLQGA